MIFEGENKIGNNRNQRGDHKKGRPSRQKQLSIKDTCGYYFENYHSASYCVQKTGYAKDTVSKYYNEFFQDIANDKGHIQRQIEVKERYIVALDGIQEVLQGQIKRIQKRISHSKFDRTLETSLTYSALTLVKIYDQKSSVEIMPTTDISLKKLIKEKWGIDIEEASQNSNSA